MCHLSNNTPGFDGCSKITVIRFITPKCIVSCQHEIVPCSGNIIDETNAEISTPHVLLDSGCFNAFTPTVFVSRLYEKIHDESALTHLDKMRIQGKGNFFSTQFHNQNLF